MSVTPPFPTPPQRVIRSSALLPLAHTAKERHAANWLAFHQANPEVYTEFCKFAEQMRVEKQRPRYSVEIVINVLRWHRDLATVGDFKINNNYKSFYARAYEHHYDCEGFFHKRESYADAVLFPPQHLGILRGSLPHPT
jgi:hypothetical protein